MTTPTTCPTCAGDTTTLEPCPDCDCVPADRDAGCYVTVYVHGAQDQEQAERLVGGMLDAATPADGLTADVVPE